MNRRTAQLALLILVLFLPVTREQLSQVWQREDVQAFVEAQTNRGAQATVALIGYVRKAQVTYVNGKPVVSAPDTAKAAAPDDFSLNTGPSLSADEFEAVLKQYNSPAQGQGLGELSVQLSQETGVDNAIVLAVGIHESGLGTAPNWAGRKPNGRTTANWGNIIGFGGLPTYGRFLDFDDDWRAGMTATFRLLQAYREGSGWGYNGKKHATIREALNTYAPPVENDTNRYADFVEQRVTDWRSVKRGVFVADGQEGQPTQHAGVKKNKRYRTPTITADGCKRTNMQSALGSSITLQNVTVEPGQSWSFNDNWKIDQKTLVDCGVYGGGVCSVAAGFSNAARHIGLTTQSVDHGMVYEPKLDREDQIAIWSAGSAGGQDLVITNTTDNVAHFWAAMDGGDFFVEAWVE